MNKVHYICRKSISQASTNEHTLQEIICTREVSCFMNTYETSCLMDMAQQSWWSEAGSDKLGEGSLSQTSWDLA